MEISEQPIAVRPTLIVGLGGTGVLVCQWVEHLIRELLDGILPPFIRFLKLDTDNIEDGGPSRATQMDFINLFHHLNVGEVVRDWDTRPRLHPHLGWLRGYRLDSATAAYGCQGVPRMGRLVFVELRDSVIRKAAAARFSAIRTSTQQRTVTVAGQQFTIAPECSPAIHITSSVCGGTGAGMLIDAAYNLRWWSRYSFGRVADVIGHLVLPEAFSVDPRVQPKLEAVAGALLEQIEFLSDERRHAVPVRYRSVRDGEDAFERLTRPFDFLYLINGHGDTGCGRRKHLVRMIARVIRAMSIEPMAQHVLSDGNNKLNEILGARDPASGRLQCFASYGYWAGTQGQRQGDVDEWIRTAFRAMVSDGGSEERDIARTIENVLTPELDAAGKAKAVTRPADAFHWEYPTAATNDADIEKSINDQVRKFLTETVMTALRTAVDRAVPRDKPNPRLLKVCNAVVDAAAFRSPTDSLSRVGACLDQWHQHLDDGLSLLQKSGRSDPDAVVQLIVDLARKQVINVAAEITGGAVIGVSEQQIVQAVKGVLDEQLSTLIEAMVRRNLLESIKLTREVVSLRCDALRAMPSVIAAENTERGGAAREKSATIGRDDGRFSTPVSEAWDPTAEVDEEHEKDEQLLAFIQTFRQNVVKHILDNVVLSIVAPTGDAAEHTTLRKKYKATREAKALETKVKDVCKEAEKQDYEAFHSPVPEGKTAAEHRLYQPVCDVLSLAEAKIDLTGNGVYEGPLCVSIAQQRQGTCMADILEYNGGGSFREAYVAKPYEDSTGIWFQVVNLSYGYCLEAISTYSSYRAAAEHYRHKRSLQFADLWLDGGWYMDYQYARERWANDIADEWKRPLDPRTPYDIMAAKIGKVRHWIAVALDATLKWIQESVADRSTTQAIGLGEDHAKVAQAVHDTLGGLAPETELADDTRGEVTQGVLSAVEKVDAFIIRLSQVRKALGLDPKPGDEDVFLKLRERLKGISADLRPAGAAAASSTGSSE